MLELEVMIDYKTCFYLIPPYPGTFWCKFVFLSDYCIRNSRGKNEANILS